MKHYVSNILFTLEKQFDFFLFQEKEQNRIAIDSTLEFKCFRATVGGVQYGTYLW